MRDKLIELIEAARHLGDMHCEEMGSCHRCHELGFDIDKCGDFAIADYLIANGVTFADVPETNVGKWIPVSERLPTERGRYWAWCKFYIRERKVERPQVRYFSPELNGFTLDGGRDGEVTHWMPIEPPKEGE